MSLGTAANRLAHSPERLRDRLDSVRKQLSHKHMLLFLDYDGTLTPIVSNPKEALLSDESRILLSQLSEKCVIAIVTGRSLPTIKDFVRISTSEHRHFCYAASHGFHIETGRRDCSQDYQVGVQFVPLLKKAKAALEDELSDIEGFLVEDNNFSLSVHYRNVKPLELVSRIEEAVDHIIGEEPKLKKTHGKKVFEVRINTDWDKGRAVLWLLEAMRVSPDDETCAIVYIGDDLTDEDAFEAIKNFSNSIGILVGDVTRPTAASLLLNDPEEVRGFLRELLAFDLLPMDARLGPSIRISTSAAADGIRASSSSSAPSTQQQRLGATAHTTLSADNMYT